MEELSSRAFHRAVAAELLATTMLLASTLGCVVFAQDGGITTAKSLLMAIMNGFNVSVLVFIFGPVSGAFMNPAVTLAFALVGKISPLRCAVFAVVQVAGAVCGAALIRSMAPAQFDRVGGGANYVGAGATATEALGVEFGCTFMLVMTAMAATDSARAKTNAHIDVIAPLVVGLAVAVANFIAIPVDSCSINPARSFGVAVVSKIWSDHWIFWLGPGLGATSAGICYTYLFQHELFHKRKALSGGG
jgi:aquaporin PIP